MFEFQMDLTWIPSQPFAHSWMCVLFIENCRVCCYTPKCLFVFKGNCLCFLQNRSLALYTDQHEPEARI